MKEEWIFIDFAKTAKQDEKDKYLWGFRNCAIFVCNSKKHLIVVEVKEGADEAVLPDKCFYCESERELEDE